MTTCCRTPIPWYSPSHPDASSQPAIMLHYAVNHPIGALKGESDLTTMIPWLQRYSRKLWTGVSHTSLYSQLKALIEHWDPRYIVVDATGVGVGLASFLEKAFENQVIPVTFSSAVKSKLGWDFLSVVETGRFKDYEDISNDSLQKLFKVQLDHTLMDISTGPNRLMKWGVPDGTRDQTSGELVHDDLVISAALCTLLDECEWGKADSTVIESLDPLSDLGDVF